MGWEGLLLKRDVFGSFVGVLKAFISIFDVFDGDVTMDLLPNGFELAFSWDAVGVFRSCTNLVTACVCFVVLACSIVGVEIE